MWINKSFLCWSCKLTAVAKPWKKFKYESVIPFHCIGENGDADVCWTCICFILFSLFFLHGMNERLLEDWIVKDQKFSVFFCSPTTSSPSNGGNTGIVLVDVITHGRGAKYKVKSNIVKSVDKQSTRGQSKRVQIYSSFITCLTSWLCSCKDFSDYIHQ